MSGHQNNHVDVIIVGCGPTGATLANLLAMSGISVLVLEREINIYDLPRAVHFDDETMRVFQTVGIADKLKTLVRVNPGMRFVDSNNNILLDWPRPQSISNQGWHASYRLHQPDLEEHLRSVMQKHATCTLLTGQNVVDVKQNSDGVSVSYSSDKSDTTTVTASYVIGCDGANSFVRNSMNIQLEDLGFKERWLVVDALLKRDIPRLGDHTIQYCDSAKPMTYCRNPGLRRRWEMALSDSVSDGEALNEQRIWDLLSRWINKNDASIERKAVYTFRSALAETWRNERVIIAGDAAHLTPPFMGQGMCAGIRDASNLAWKLARCIKRGHSASLLDSYTLERRPHVREYIGKAIDLGRLINSMDQSKTIKNELNGNCGNQKMASISPNLGDSEIAPNNALMSENSGVLSAQPALSNGQKLDDYCGYAPVLLVKDPSLLIDIENMPMSYFGGKEHPEINRALDDLNSSAVLVRPDRYIFGVARNNSQIADLVNSYLRLTLLEK